MVRLGKTCGQADIDRRTSGSVDVFVRVDWRDLFVSHVPGDCVTANSTRLVFFFGFVEKNPPLWAYYMLFAQRRLAVPGYWLLVPG